MRVEPASKQVRNTKMSLNKNAAGESVILEHDLYGNRRRHLGLDLYPVRKHTDRSILRESSLEKMRFAKWSATREMSRSLSFTERRIITSADSS